MGAAKTESPKKERSWAVTTACTTGGSFAGGHVAELINFFMNFVGAPAGAIRSTGYLVGGIIGLVLSLLFGEYLRRFFE